ncbi:hypothetical protein OSTOST_24981 [Ostertagia ostertagi]
MSARGKVSQRSAPKQNVSQRTSSRSAPAPPSERSAPSQPPGAAPGEEQDIATKILTTIQNILTELVTTTFRLIKVSKEAGLWSWSQLWDMFYAHTFAR